MQVVSSRDEEDYDMIRHVPACARYIEEGLQRGDAVLVHSTRGLSR